VDTPSATTSRLACFERVQPELGQRRLNEVDDVAIGLSARHDIDGVLFRRHVEVNVQHAFRMVHLVQEHPAGIGRRVARQDRVGGRQLVELPEHLLLQLEPLGNRFDYQPCVANGLGEVGLGADLTGAHAREFVGEYRKLLRHIANRSIPLGFGEIVDRHLCAVCGEHERDAPSECAGADDGYWAAGVVGGYGETHWSLLVVLRGVGR
jgi:hypothetical protein